MKLQLGPQIIGSYKRLAYKIWYAIAEFVDNSTQAYFNNKEILDEEFNSQKTNLFVKIEYGKDRIGRYIRISDNSIGMTKEELENAVIIGKPPDNTEGRSKYGLGMKTAAFWLGNHWEIETTKLGENEAHKLVFKEDQITKGNLDLDYSVNKLVTSDEHYTILTIRTINRGFKGTVINKIKDYLRSMYRVDINTYGLKLYFNDDLLTWNVDEQINKRLIINKDGSLVKRDFNFEIVDETDDNKVTKYVSGWAGVFDKGSRRDAGFSLIQSNRVINGWPDSYRPAILFGSQVGGRNDLVNQRLVGEIYLQGFEVSHTKDAILFTGDEQDYLENQLMNEFVDFWNLAKSYRKYSADERMSSDVKCNIALNEFENELRSPEIADSIFNIEVPTVEQIKASNKIVKDTVVEKSDPTMNVQINSIEVLVYVVDDLSPNDPYVIIESTESKERVIVIVNKTHPYWIHLTSQESILNFLRHCTYDGVAEWKAYHIVGNIDPDTIKLIKDNLLRLPFEIESHAN